MTATARNFTTAIAQSMRRSDTALWLAVFATTAVIYLVTCHRGPVVSIDTAAANAPSWWFVHHGTFFLDGYHTKNPWFFDAGGHLVSNRMGGAILFGLPLQALFAGVHASANAVGALTAALASAAAIANLSLVFRRLGASLGLALAASACLALGTGMWTVSSAELWTHTANCFWLSCALLALTRNRTLLAGLLIAPVIPTRPHLVVVIAVIGLWLAIKRRSWVTLTNFAVPAFVSLVALLAWNDHIYGTVTIGGGYAGREDALTGSDGAVWTFVRDVAGTLGSPLRGVLLYSPIIIVAVLCIPAGWRRAPDWARAALVGGVLYEVIQLRLNRFSGGTLFYSNRLVLELFLLASPIVVCGYQEWRARGSHRAAIAQALTAISVSIHALGAFLPNAYLWHPQHWTTWGPIAAVRYEPGRAVGLLVLLAAIGVIATLWPLRRPAPAGESAAQPEPALTSR